MLNLAFGFTCSFLIILLIVRSAGKHALFSMDGDLHSVQKNHVYAVPRIGGIGIACAAVATTIAEPLWATGSNYASLLLLLCAVPAFASGVAEDVTKLVSPRIRLLCAFASALMACLLLNAVVTRVDVPMIDQWLRVLPLAIGFTMLGTAGLTNAVNIIDGFNGLASVVAMMIFGSIGYIAYQVNDWPIMSMALTMVGALGGFVLWNFPTPSVFLGDGGAYFLGFIMAELLVLLIARHPNIPVWYAVSIAIYPVFETLFSIYRRRVLHGKPADEPDRLHLHSLVYRRIARRGYDPANLRQKTLRNSYTSIYMWALSLIGIGPATLFWDSRFATFGASVLFVLAYTRLYIAIVRLKTPRWLLFPGHQHTRVTTPDVEQSRH